MEDSSIKGDMVINEVIRLHPWTLPVFHHYGVDSCCGGAQTIAFAARSMGIELDDLLAALEKAAEDQDQ